MMKSEFVEEDIDEQGLPIISRTNSLQESDSESSKKSARKSKEKGKKQECSKANLEKNEEFSLDIDLSLLKVEELNIDPSILEFRDLIQNDIVLKDNNSTSDTNEEITEDPVALKKAQRKAEKKRKKQERRAQREGRGDPSSGQKNCDMCDASVDLLIRCTYDESLQWKMICGKCWNKASGKFALSME